MVSVSLYIDGTKVDLFQDENDQPNAEYSERPRYKQGVCQFYADLYHPGVESK
jgi:hypothetical protein